jgi:hypothetical protein
MVAEWNAITDYATFNTRTPVENAASITLYQHSARYNAAGSPLAVPYRHTFLVNRTATDGTL